MCVLVHLTSSKKFKLVYIFYNLAAILTFFISKKQYLVNYSFNKS